MSFLLRMQDSTLTSLSNLVCPNVRCQSVFFRIRTQMARRVKAFRVDWKSTILIEIQVDICSAIRNMIAFISRARPLGQFAARAWQACGCWKPTAACARQRGSSCEWTCSKFHHFERLLYQASFWPVECLTHVHQFNCWWNIIMKHSR